MIEACTPSLACTHKFQACHHMFVLTAETYIFCQASRYPHPQTLGCKPQQVLQASTAASLKLLCRPQTCLQASNLACRLGARDTYSVKPPPTHILQLWGANLNKFCKPQLLQASKGQTSKVGLQAQTWPAGPTWPAGLEQEPVWCTQSGTRGSPFSSPGALLPMLSLAEPKHILRPTHADCCLPHSCRPCQRDVCCCRLAIQAIDFPSTGLQSCRQSGKDCTLGADASVTARACACCRAADTSDVFARAHQRQVACGLVDRQHLLCLLVLLLRCRCC